MIEKIILYALLIAFVAFSSYTITKPQAGKHGYIINQKVFDAFKGKNMLEEKLKIRIKEHANNLDSLQNLIDNSPDESLVEKYKETERQYDLEEQELTNRFTADLWKEINQYVEQYGKEKGYDFIYGATGNGSLMYGSNSFDLTQDIVEFINKKYEEGN